MHRSILAASSSFFSTKFDQLPALRTLVIPNQAAVAVRSLIEYCYTGHIAFDMKIIQSLLRAAQTMEFVGVESAGWEFLLDRLNPENCLRVEQFALECKKSDCLRRVKEFIWDKFLEVVRTEDFLQMSKERLAQLLWNDYLYATERDIFLAIMAWIGYDYHTRRLLFPGFMAVIRIELLETTVGVKIEITLNKFILASKAQHEC